MLKDKIVKKTIFDIEKLKKDTKVFVKENEPFGEEFIGIVVSCTEDLLTIKNPSNTGYCSLSGDYIPMIYFIGVDDIKFKEWQIKILK